MKAAREWGRRATADRSSSRLVARGKVSESTRGRQCRHQSGVKQSEPPEGVYKPAQYDSMVFAFTILRCREESTKGVIQ